MRGRNSRQGQEAGKGVLIQPNETLRNGRTGRAFLSAWMSCFIAVSAIVRASTLPTS
jgi:hypothetical protein